MGCAPGQMFREVPLHASCSPREAGSAGPYSGSCPHMAGWVHQQRGGACLEWGQPDPSPTPGPPILASLP